MESPLKPTASPYELVTDDRRLAELAEIWQQSAVVAVDTEFMRRNSYFHRPGLVQVASSKGTALLDPCSLRNWQPFKSLMMDSAVIKLMHAAHEDVELLRSCYGIAPEKLLDSQIAVSLVSERAAVSISGWWSTICRCAWRKMKPVPIGFSGHFPQPSSVTLRRTYTI